MNAKMKEFKVTYDESALLWEDNKQYNEESLRVTQSFLDKIFGMKGYLFLDHIYDKLGIDITDLNIYGAGWVYDPSNPDMDHIDFHIGEEMDGDNFVLRFKVFDNIIDIMRA